MKLAPAGVTIRELIEEYSGGMQDGHTLKGFLPGGASGGVLPESMADIPLDFGTLEKSAWLLRRLHAVVILSDQEDMKAVALNLMKFFEDEIVRPMHALPRWDREGRQTDAAGARGTRRCSMNCQRRCAMLRSAGSARPRPIRCKV